MMTDHISGLRGPRKSSRLGLMAVILAGILLARHSAGLQAFESQEARAQASQDLIKPAINITSCTSPFRASTAGATYNVAADLTGSTFDCIEIVASGITLKLNGHTLTGASKASGVDIFPGETGVHVTGPGTIQGFSIGVDDRGDSALIENLTVEGNVTGGILLDGTNSSVVTGNPVISNNGTYGVFLANTNNSVVEHNAQISGNGAAGYGIWIENTSTNQTVSTNNIVAANVVDNSASQAFGIWVGYNNAYSSCPAVAPSTGNIIVNNTAVDANGTIGIGLQCNAAADTTVLHNSATGNGTFNAYDGNASCGSNYWNVDTFTPPPNPPTNQPCVL